MKIKLNYLGTAEDGMRIATSVSSEMRSVTVKQCAVLLVAPGGKQTTHAAGLREMGFIVDEIADWPEQPDVVRDYHVVVVQVPSADGAPMLAARLRAKPHFGRRLLIALVDPGTVLHARRSAQASGFDEVMNECCQTRQLAARILRGIRTRPELRCALPPTLGRRSAA